MYVDNFEYNEGNMQAALSSFFAPNSVKYEVDGLYVFDWESDKLMETKSGYIYEFEIKISKADFKNDFKHKKDKHIILAGEEKYGDKFLPRYYELLEENRKIGPWAEQSFLQYAPKCKRYQVTGHRRPNYFYYAVPTDMIKTDDVPEYAGLIYVDEHGRLSVVKKAPCLHKEKYTDVELNYAEKFYYNMVTWKKACGRHYRDYLDTKKRLDEELHDKGREKPYDILEIELKSANKDRDWLKEHNEKLSKDIRYDSQFIRALSRKIKSLDPEFDINVFEKEFGDRYDRGDRNYSFEDENHWINAEPTLERKQ